MSDQPTPAAAAAPAKTSKLPLLAGGVLLLAAGAGGGYWFLSGSAAAAKEKPAAAEEGEAHGDSGESGHAAEPQGVVALDPFVVNLADQGAGRFLRLTLKLVAPLEATAEVGEDEVVKARVRSAILELLAQQSGERLVTPEGKDELKHEIAARARKAAKGLHVTDVLFSEFVVQF